MKTQKHYWKVVNKGDEGLLYSWSKWPAVRYIPNKFVNSPSSLGLFVFDTRKNARLICGTNDQVWKCEVRNPRQPENEGWYLGTTLCDSVKLIHKQ